MPEYRRSYCGLCHPRCGLLLEVEKDRIVSVQGDPEHPVTKGVICERGRLMAEHVHHPQRLNHPLKRKGEKGSGQWQRLSWDQALDEVAEKLDRLRERFGPETLAFTHGTKRTYHWDERRFFNLFGSPNVCGANNICMCPSNAVEYATYGGFSWGDVMQTDCIVLWGHAPSKSSPTGFYPKIVQAQKRGARLIVVDPRRIREAEKADMWLPIRPGTDVALMLGWLRYIMENELFDHDFVQRWTTGFEDLRAAAAGYTPEKVAEITGLSQEQIVKSARLYATIKPATIPWGYGLDKQGNNATQAARARSCLRAITGNLDVPGGEPLGCADPVGRIIGEEEMELNQMLSSTQRAKQLGADIYPFFGFPGWEKNYEANRSLPREYMHPPNADRTSVAHARDVFQAMLTGRPYPVKAAISVASNPVLSLPDSFKTREALKSLDLYVVGEFFMTPSAALADYVFPICSTVETTELWLSDNFCVACPRGIDPLFERRNTYDFWRGLGVRLGQKDYWPWERVEEAWNYRLAPLGLDFAKLLEKNGIFGTREYGRYKQYGFGTPSGKVELRSSILDDLGAEPVPLYRESPWTGSSHESFDNSYPLILITGSRFMPMYHSEQRQIQAAREKRPHPLVTLHPETAASLGLEPDQEVLVESPHGSIKMRLAVSDMIDPGMADADHGWWFPEREEAEPGLFGAFESNANVLCPDDPRYCSPEIGSWPHSGLPCRVRSVSSGFSP